MWKELAKSFENYFAKFADRGEWIDREAAVRELAAQLGKWGKPFGAAAVEAGIGEWIISGRLAEWPSTDGGAELRLTVMGQRRAALVMQARHHGHLTWWGPRSAALTTHDRGIDTIVSAP